MFLLSFLQTEWGRVDRFRSEDLGAGCVVLALTQGSLSAAVNF